MQGVSDLARGTALIGRLELEGDLAERFPLGFGVADGVSECAVH
jgi:hypothetical protein